MTGVEFRNRSPYRARSMGRTGFGWSPVQLALYAWYDVHAGGTTSTIVDKSGNGRADATFGAAAAAPLFVPYTGIPYVHLEAAGSGTNSISCTAPANTASYSAAPLGGGAPTTGAAAAGAFAFTTAGDWLTISLLDAGAVELARFVAADCTQSGVTDSFAVAWTINRGTAGRKTVVLGPTAKSTRSLVLFGTNDHINLSNVFDFVFADSFTAFAAIRQHGASASSNVIIANKASTAFATAGFALRTSNTFGEYLGNVGDGSNGPFAIPGVVATTGKASMVTFTRDTAADRIQTSLNTTSGTLTSDTTVTTITGASPARFGQLAGAGTANIDMEFMGAGEVRRAITTAEIALLSAYYGGGL